MDEALFTLRASSLFAEAPDVLLAEMASQLREVRVAAGTTVVTKGEPGECMYLVADGRLEVIDGGRVLNHLTKRDFFGEMAMLDAEPRSATVVAVEPTRLFQLQQADVYAVMARHPEIMHALLRALSRRVRALLRDMASDYDYIRQFGKVTSTAVAIEAGVYEPEQLDDVANRVDDLGLLARILQRAIREVYGREQRLKAEVAELRIEIDAARQARQVAEVTDTDYFRKLRQRASEMRSGSRDTHDAHDEKGHRLH